jgi:peptidoglycan/LPS O-acetylase OafA/YrhL
VIANTFSLRRNWQYLLAPQGATVRPVDGIRALSVLWVMAFHIWWFLSFFISPASSRALTSDAALRFVWCGDLGVDCFFTISGFLIAGLLMDQYDAGRTFWVGRFYIRRAMRILPVYVVALGIYCWLELRNCNAAWANLLMVSNFVPVEAQCMPWSWSLAVEEQFYLCIPLLLYLVYALRPRYRSWLLLGVLGVAVGISFRLVIGGGFALPLPTLPSLARSEVTRLFDTIYDKPHARVGPLVIGVLAAYFRRYTRILQWLETTWAGGGAFIALVTLSFVCIYPSRDPDLANVPRWLSVTYIAGFRVATSASVAYLLLLSLSSHPAGRLLSKFLSHPWWHPIAQLSYSVYLLHPICIVTLYNLAKPPEAPSRTVVLGYAAVATVMSFLAGAVTYLFIERPIMNLRPSSTGPVHVERTSRSAADL